MESKLDSFFYGTDTKAYVSYDVPRDSITKRFDFSKPTDEHKWGNSISNNQIFGIIEAIHDNYVVINCLVNQEESIIQRRKFDIEPLKDVLELYEGEGVEIIINTFAGKREFIYTASDEAKDLFEEPEDIFSQHKNSSFFSKEYGD